MRLDDARTVGEVPVEVSVNGRVVEIGERPVEGAGSVATDNPRPRTDESSLVHAVELTRAIASADTRTERMD